MNNSLSCNATYEFQQLLARSCHWMAEIRDWPLCVKAILSLCDTVFGCLISLESYGHLAMSACVWLCRVQGLEVLWRFFKTDSLDILLRQHGWQWQSRRSVIDNNCCASNNSAQYDWRPLTSRKIHHKLGTCLPGWSCGKTLDCRAGGRYLW